LLFQKVMKLNSKESILRNELVFTADAKSVNIENVLLNLFMLLKSNGVRPKMLLTSEEKKQEDSIDLILKYFAVLESQKEVSGFLDYREAAMAWVRCNLVNMVNRGKSGERVSSLRPIHLESYKIRNAKHARDYNTADQVYLMLNTSPVIKQELTNFLSEGWDKSNGQIGNVSGLDIDSFGILTLIKNRKTKEILQNPTSISNINPLLESQAEVFCEDVKRLLLYKNVIPRAVLLDYLKTIISFHLSLYLQKLVYLLPKMVKAGTKEVVDDWSIVLDLTDNLDSDISTLSIEDADKVVNGFRDYIKATFQINTALAKLNLTRDSSQHLKQALEYLKENSAQLEAYCQAQWNNLQLEEDEEQMIKSFSEYEPTFFGKWVELIMQQKGGLQYKEHVRLFDRLSFKNDERGLLAQGRSRKHPRRFMMGTKLLETLTQISLLDESNGTITSRSLSIEGLIEFLRNRYGLIINGLHEQRFDTADIRVIHAFRDNMEAFKRKLRQIGFYNDLSDAFILQKIRPRYKV
jgi:hypothetical protein